MSFHNSPHQTRPLKLATMILAAALLAPGLNAAQNLYNSEIWISPDSATPGTGTKSGTGTITDPYVGDFDYIVHTYGLGKTMHLLPGTHITRGARETGTPGTFQTANDFVITSNTKIIGHTREDTIIQKQTGYSGYADSHLGSVIYAGTSTYGIEIREVTIDGNITDETFATKRNGIYLLGSNSKVSDVNVVNLSGYGNYEAFAIQIGTLDGSSYGNIVDNCIVVNMHRNYVSGITTFGQAVVRNNTVIFNPASTSSASDRNFAYNCGAPNNLLVQGNYCYGAAVGFYNDTGSGDGIIVANNIFDRVQYGAFINQVNTVRNVQFINNLVKLDDLLTIGSGLFLRGFAIYAGHTSAQVASGLISGNRVVPYTYGATLPLASTQPVFIQGWTNFVDSRVAGWVVRDNILANQNLYLPSANTIAFGNKDIPGNDIHKLTSTTATSLGLWTNLFRASEIIVANGGTTSIMLPTAGQMAGQDVRIFNNQNSSSITIGAYPAEKIGSNTNLLSLSAQTSMRLYSDGTQWYKQ